MAQVSCLSLRKTCLSLDDEREFYLIPTAEVPITNIYPQ